jgi:hypothetical protein
MPTKIRIIDECDQVELAVAKGGAFARIDVLFLAGRSRTARVRSSRQHIRVSPIG